MNSKNTLPKYQRLYKRDDINLLFDAGRHFVNYPYKVVFYELSNEQPTCSMLISVPKKRFHHAVYRNRLKRLTREAWRCNKQVLDEMCLENNKSLYVALIYTGTVLHSFEKIENSIQKIITQLVRKHEKTNEVAG